MIKLLQFVSLEISKNGITKKMLCKQNSYFPRIFYCHGSFKGIPGKQKNPRIDDVFRKADRIPPKFNLVYKSGLTNYIIWFYPLGVLSYVFAIIAYYYFKIHLQQMSYPVSSGVAPMTYRNATEVEITLAFYLAMNTLTLYVLRRSPIRIWMEPTKGEYRMVLIGTLPPFKRQIAFKGGEVTRKHLYPQNEFQETIHWYRRRFYYISSLKFREPADYYKMIGHNPNIND